MMKYFADFTAENVKCELQNPNTKLETNFTFGRIRLTNNR